MNYDVKRWDNNRKKKGKESYLGLHNKIVYIDESCKV